ncbi:hypothetical protein FLAG1_03944 [Fusarium langsethiae]|uniref:Uncharacterized protein n=1 Tax=Fusarium langsethiae TaxID=179993 RepID=A0A0N0V7I1_FUSLA|nr:hypothetical protein FLAG1_03944 [Fusarium langsethiae]GKT98447.1 unnamed protein product [Fusarium langsethiae]GKU13986.1 unnamed protein product [Fusarium langsethiae]
MSSSTLEDLVQAPEHQIRAILRALCRDTDIRARALEHDDLQAIDTPSDTKKRKAGDELCICVQCDEAFFNNDNTVTCCYHWGELEVDYDAHVWADHDERCHGTIDSEEMRKENPEGFTWTCCDKPGDKTGCKLGKHEADPLKSRREASSEPSDINTSAFGSDNDEDDEDGDSE